MKIRPTKRSLDKFEWFAQCPDTARLQPVETSEDGHSAAECFHVMETYGKSIPCREPELLARALNGKEQHGMTISMIAEDYLDRLIFAAEIHREYPEWVQRDIFGRAAQFAQKKHGFVPKFIQTGNDFTTLKMSDAKLIPAYA